MIRIKPYIALIIGSLTVLISCSKAVKKVPFNLPDEKYVITSLTLNGEEKLEAFYSDSCFCKEVYFNYSYYDTLNYPNQNRVYFSDCNKTVDWGIIESKGTFNWSDNSLNSNAAELFFTNYSLSNNQCTCGRYGWASYFLITKMNNKGFTMEVEFPGEKWVLKLQKK